MTNILNCISKNPNWFSDNLKGLSDNQIWLSERQSCISKKKLYMSEKKNADYEQSLLTDNYSGAAAEKTYSFTERSE